MTHPNNLNTDRYYDSINLEPSGPPSLPRATETSEAALEALVAELVRMVRDGPLTSEVVEVIRRARPPETQRAVFRSGVDAGVEVLAEAILHRLGISDDDLDAYDRAMAAWREREESEG